MKNIYKIGVLMLYIIVLWNCQTSDQIHQNQESFNPNYKRTLIDLKTFANEFSTENSKYSQLMELFSPKELTHFNSKQRVSTAKIRNFILDKNAILKIQQEQKVTYTIPAKPDVDTGTFFNLVIATNAEGILLHGHLLEYKPSVKWLKNTNLPYTGKVRIVQQKISNLSTILNSGKLVLQRICPLVIRGSWTCSFGNNHAPGECNGSYFNFNLYMIPDCTQGGGGTDNTTNTYTDIGNPLDTGGGSGGNGGGNTATTTPMIPSGNNGIENEHIFNFLTGKANCVFKKLKNSNTGFKKMIQKFDGDFPVSHLIFKEEDLGKIRGETNPPLNGYSPDFNITIVLNNNSSKNGINFRPNLLIAKTIVHEVIHAEMFRKLLSLTKQPNFNLVNDQQLKALLSNKDFPGIYDYFRRYNNWQHQQMADHYRDSMARILQEYDTGIKVSNNIAPKQLYMDLAWEGLYKSKIKAWTDLPKTEQTRVRKAIADYINLNKNQNCQ